MNEKEFQRIYGLKTRQFNFLLELFVEYVEDNWNTLKGGISLETRLKLTLRYLRSYPTFLEVGKEFKVSEGYAYKLFTKSSKALIQILKLPKLKNLKNLENLVIDVTEQATERPKKNSKNLILENKSAILKKP
jgi:hypothetical protein